MNNQLIIGPDDLDAIAAVDMLELQHPSGETQGFFTALATQIQEPKPIHASCSTRYHAKRISGRRPLRVIRQQIIHSEEAWTALAAAMWFSDPESRGSAHYCADDNNCYRTLWDDEIPWGAPGANYIGLHYEQAGFAHWTQILWSRTHRKTLMRTASKMARDARRYRIQLRWLTHDQLRAGLSGQATHWDCTQVFGGTHTDPGKGYPKRLLMTFIKLYYNTVHRRVQPAI